MKGDRNISKRSKKYSKTRFLSSFKLSFSNYGKLVLIGLVFSIFLIGGAYLSKNNTLNNASYVAVTNAQEEYYARLEKVYNEYKADDKDFSELVITSAFSIMQSNIPDFTYDDMSEARMREVADLMLDEVEHEDGTYTYTAKGEDAVKESLADYFKGIDSSLEDVTCTRMANDVYQYVEDYLEFIGSKEDEMGDRCLSTGNTQASIFLNMSTDEYIATMGPIAQADFSRNDVFASVTLAQSIIESGWGKSGLTQQANNMFGIKCSSNWDGECINMETGEYGSTGYYTTDSNFRKYNSIEDSVNDHSLFLKENPRYPNAGVFDATTYQEQIRAIHSAGYATDPNYSSTIINTIEMYDLDKWDVPINVSSDLCYTGEGQWTIRTIAPSSSDVAFTRKSSNRGQCVWYAQARAYEVALELASKGIITDEEAASIGDKLFSIYGDAGVWVNASSGTFRTSTDINDLQAGAIISWTKSGGYGHVAFIEEVTSDSVTITEGWATNTNSCPNDWSCINFRNRTMTLDEFYNSFGPYYSGSYDFSGYIFPLEG